MRELIAAIFLSLLSTVTLFPAGSILWITTCEDMEDKPFAVRLLSYTVSYLLITSPIWVFFLTGWVVGATNG